MRIKSLNLLVMLSVLAATLDCTVRYVDNFFTESPIAQIAVFLSPIIYIALLTSIVIKFRWVALKMSPQVVRVSAFLLSLYSLVVLTQVFSNGQSVGSAWYSVVSPLYISGVPLSVLTFLVFFSEERSTRAGCFIALISVAWLIMPAGIDLLFAFQGGYRGSYEPFQVPVLGTIYDLIQYLAVIMFLLSLIAWGVALLAGVYIYNWVKNQNKLNIFSVSLSVITLTIQFSNWAGFVLD